MIIVGASIYLLVSSHFTMMYLIKLILLFVISESNTVQSWKKKSMYPFIACIEIQRVSSSQIPLIQLTWLTDDRCILSWSGTFRCVDTMAQSSQEWTAQQNLPKVPGQSKPRESSQTPHPSINMLNANVQEGTISLEYFASRNHNWTYNSPKQILNVMATPPKKKTSSWLKCYCGTLREAML